jgi:glycosyltransferase involved in cell wall biosynthesis
MEKKKILISFLITHYNRPLDLMECLEGIRKINISNYEIVVSDDGSDDENSKLLKEYKIDKLILAKTNQGLAANINKGIESCEGEYIIYCQEDFVLDSQIGKILPECLELLESKKADMIRFTANYKFNKLINLSENILLIPKFSFQNFLLNYYQYSDHPFITKKSFYNKYGYYLQNTSGRYGETEYAIRIFKSNAKIAITKNSLVTSVVDSK